MPLHEKKEKDKRESKHAQNKGSKVKYADPLLSTASAHSSTIFRLSSSPLPPRSASRPAFFKQAFACWVLRAKLSTVLALCDMTIFSDFFFFLEHSSPCVCACSRNTLFTKTRSEALIEPIYTQEVYCEQLFGPGVSCPLILKHSKCR